MSERCGHNWSEEMHEGVSSRFCHICNEWEIEVAYDRALAEIDRLLAEVEDRDRGLVICHEELRELGEESDRMSLSLRNVAALAKRLRKTDPVNAEHFLRFCREAGWEDSILREAE